MIGLPGNVIYSDMQNLTNCACSGQKGEKGQDGSVIFVNDTTNVVAKGEKGERGARGKKGKQGPMVKEIILTKYFKYSNVKFFLKGPPGRPVQGDIGVPGYPVDNLILILIFNTNLTNKIIMFINC